MAITYRVVDIRGDVIDPKETLITGARTPEDAVREALKLEVVRNGQRKDIVARVYWQLPGEPMNMVRLYQRMVG